MFYARLNRVFHASLYRAAHNRFLERALQGLRDSMALLGGTSLQVAGRYDTAHAEHETLIAALETRDEAGAASAARAHIRNAQRARLKLLRARMINGDEADPPAE